MWAQGASALPRLPSSRGCSGARARPVLLLRSTFRTQPLRILCSSPTTACSRVPIIVLSLPPSVLPMLSSSSISAVPPSPVGDWAASEPPRPGCVDSPWSARAVRAAQGRASPPVVERGVIGVIECGSSLLNVSTRGRPTSRTCRESQSYRAVHTVCVPARVRVRVKIMGLIIIRTG
jgi:hypothetical protein